MSTPPPPSPPSPLTTHAVPVDTGHPVGASQAEFQTLVAQHVEQYRPPVGSLTHTATRQVSDPYTPPNRDARERARRINRSMGFFAVGGAAAMTGFELMTIMASGMRLEGAIGMTVSVVTTLGFLLWRNPAYNAAVLAANGETLNVPVDVATAYRTYAAAPLALRKAHANENAVAQVEAHLPYMDDLLTEAARLHAADLWASEEAQSVRTAMVRLAAHAQTLTVLAERSRMATDAAALSTPALLMRHPDESTFETLGERMLDETTFVRGILNP